MATLGVSDLHQSQEKNSDLWAAVKLPATQHSSWSVLATRPATAGSSSADYFYIELFQMTNFVPVNASWCWKKTLCTFLIDEEDRDTSGKTNDLLEEARERKRALQGKHNHF